MIPLHKGSFCRCCWNRRDVISLSVVRTITASRENQNRGELLGDQVIKTASHRNSTLQVTLIEFEQLLHGPCHCFRGDQNDEDTRTFCGKFLYNAIAQLRVQTM